MQPGCVASLRPASLRTVFAADLRLAGSPDCGDSRVRAGASYGISAGCAVAYLENEAPSMRTEGASEHSGGAIALLAPATTALILRRKRASEIDGAVPALEVGVEILAP